MDHQERIPLNHIEQAASMGVAVDDFIGASPAIRDRMRKEALVRRAEVRRTQSLVFGPQGIIAEVEKKLGWPLGYLAHLAQSFCDCGPDNGGWRFCVHARDHWPELV